MELHAGLNTLDCIVIGTILVSGLLAIFTGFVREMYSLFNWAASYFVAAHLSFLILPLVEKYISNHTTATDVAIFVLFCISFIILGLLGTFVTSLVKGKALTAIDRSLGFVFGLVRGVLVVCLVYLVANAVLWPDIDKAPVEKMPVATVMLHDEAQPVPPEKPEKQADKETRKGFSMAAPQWLLNARTRPLLAHGANALREFVPDKMLEKTTQKYLDKKDALDHGIVEDADILEKKDRQEP